MSGPTAGDRVHILVVTPGGEVSHEGVLLAPTQPYHVTVKLPNGYNVTFAENEVTSMNVIGKLNSPVEQTAETKNEDDTLPEVWILHTGGTIASNLEICGLMIFVHDTGI